MCCRDQCLLFNIYLCDLLLFKTNSNIPNYADDAIQFEYEANLIEARTKIETESLKVFEWFRDNYLKANSTKSPVMLATNNIVQADFWGNIMSNEKTVKLLGMIVDNKLSFEPHLSNVFKKLSQKLHVLARISTHI